MTQFDALYYDGRTSARTPVRATSSDGSLRIAGPDLELEIPLIEIGVDAPLADTPRALHLPGGAQLKTADHAAIDTLFAHRHRIEHAISRFEGRWHYALAALALVAAVSAWAIVYGLPLGAQLAASMIPSEVEARLGDQALASIDGGLCRPSRIDAQRQEALAAQFALLTGGLDDGYRYRLEPRACNMGPNAFALPGGAVVLTDELVNLAQNDSQVAAVLAHEIGHVRHRHALRKGLQAAGLAALITTLAGDAVSMTSLAATLPVALLESGYSRDFEDEADSYAFQRLKEVGISPRHFADMMARLDEKSRKAEAGTKAAGYLSTHPATSRRIERALAAQ